jgi:hypothetical protein
MRREIKAIKEAKDSEERAYKITGSPDVLDSFEEILSAISYLCHVGASRTLKIYVDGDGSANLMAFKANDDKLYSDKVDLDKEETSWGIS